MRSSAPHRCEQPEPWLSQGDIFKSVPTLSYGDDHINLKPRVDNSPGMLITHDCALDKKSKSNEGVPDIERLAFVRLRAVSGLTDARIQHVRGNREKLAPFEILYLGEIQGLEESYINLSDTYFLPAGYFKPTLKTFDSEDESHLFAQFGDTRILRLGPSDRDLLHDKLSAYWTRLAPKREEIS